MFAYFISVLVRLSKRWPWFFGFFLYGILNDRFQFEDKFFAWANDKLDERTPELVSMILDVWQQAPPLTVPIIGFARYRRLIFNSSDKAKGCAS